MDTDLVVSLGIAKKILKFKRDELRILIYILQEYKSLDDDLIILLAHCCDVSMVEIEHLVKSITSLEDQIAIFGKSGLPKEIDIFPKEDYPDNQQPENI